VVATSLPWFANSLNAKATFSALSESYPVVGSSSNNKEGSVISSHAIETLFLSPPEIPLTSPSPMHVFLHFS